MSILRDGIYTISNGDKVACNFPATGPHPPFITSISFAGLSGPFSDWAIKHVGQGAYSITNVGSNFKAFVKREQPGESVDGNSDKGVNFAIQPAGQNEYVVKVVNADLVWTVREGQPFRAFLEPEQGDGRQRFRFLLIAPTEN